MTGLNLQTIQLSMALMGHFGPILSGFFVFFSKLSTCLQYAGDSRQHKSKEVIYATRWFEIFPTVKGLVDSSTLGLPMDYLGPTACNSLAIQLITAKTGAWEILQSSKLTKSYRTPLAAHFGFTTENHSNLQLAHPLSPHSV